MSGTRDPSARVMEVGKTGLDGWQSSEGVEEAQEFSAVSILTRSLASLETYSKESHLDHSRSGEHREQIILSKPADEDWICRSKRHPVESKKVDDSVTDESSIPDEFKSYAGPRQSPIIIQSETTIQWRFPPLQFHHHWNRHETIKLTNTGNSVQMSFDRENTNASQPGMPYLSGGPLGAEYEFVQLHFHWGCKDHIGCEHIIDGKRYGMEAHLVHYNRRYGNVEEAFKHKDGLAVIGIFLQVGEKRNLYLDTLAAKVQDVCSEKGNCTTLENQQPLLWVKEAVLEHNAKSQSGGGGYFTYLGSLTTPEYNENVIWILFPDPVSISSEQVAEFRKLMSPKGRIVENYREIQPIESRHIYYAK